MHVFTLPDMSCGHCVAAITRAVQAADAGARIEADLATHTARVDSPLPREQLAAALDAAGYPPTPDAT